MPEQTDKGQAILKLVELSEGIVETYNYGNEGVAMFTDAQIAELKTAIDTVRSFG